MGRSERMSESSSPMWYKAHTNQSFELDYQEVYLNALTESSTPLKFNEGAQSISVSPLRKLEKLDINQMSSEMKHDTSNLGIGSQELTSKASSFGIKNRFSGQIDKADVINNEVEPTTDSASLIHETQVISIVEPDRDRGNENHALNCGTTRNLTASQCTKKRRFNEPNSRSANHSTSSPKENKPTGSFDTMSNVTPIDASDVDSKLNISVSESTPCPSQPRKRPRMEPELFENTPTSRCKNSPLLNLSSSKKLSIESVPLLSKLNSISANKNSSLCQSNAAKTPFSDTSVPGAIPISQSTPSTSSTSSPARYASSFAGETCSVTPETHITYNSPPTETYSESFRSKTTRSSYTTTRDYSSGSYLSLPIDNYQIVGDFPVTSAGLMDETKWSVHIADKRINDPYLSAPLSPSLKVSKHDLFRRYTTSDSILPLLEHHNRELQIDEMKYLIEDEKSVREFYEMIQSSSQLNLHDLLKKERLRWHPDKWESRIEESPLDIKIIISLSQVINRLLSEI